MPTFLSPEQAPISLTFLTFIALFLGVGIYSGLHQTETTEDYLLASRNVNPWFTALSAIATGNSGFMFIGLIGFTYQVGVSTLWLSIGWLIGDWIAWFTVHQRLREISEVVGSETISAFLGHTLPHHLPEALRELSGEPSREVPGNPSREVSGEISEGAIASATIPPLSGESHSRWITIVSALITLFFLGAYAAAQLQAGSKALTVIFGWDYSVGVFLGAIVVAIYCLTGGIRASIWIGSVQAVIMIGSMLLLLGVALTTAGGVPELLSQLRTIDAALLSPIPVNLQFGFLPFLLSWIVAGFGVVGQPHIMVRAMAIDSAENIQVARNVYLVLQTLFSVAAIAVGLASRVLLPDLMALGGDVELALPELATYLLPGLLVGLVLAGLFSATLSTADAQVLSCSAALTQDIFPKAARSLVWVRVGTLCTILVVLAIALLGSDSVFTLVTFAWAALAAGLGPLMVIRTLQRPVRPAIGVTMILTGVAVALLWRFGFHWSGSLYEVLPGMVASSLVYGLGNISGK